MTSFGGEEKPSVNNNAILIKHKTFWKEVLCLLKLFNSLSI
jgi:hypothetical protein